MLPLRNFWYTKEPEGTKGEEGDEAPIVIMMTRRPDGGRGLGKGEVRSVKRREREQRREDGRGFVKLSGANRSYVLDAPTRWMVGGVGVPFLLVE